MLATITSHHTSAYLPIAAATAVADVTELVDGFAAADPAFGCRVVRGVDGELQ